MSSTTIGGAPVITSLTVVPVAGRDSMLLNLSGAHGPFFTRNLVILRDNAGHTGVGEVPGGEAIRKTLEEAAPLVAGPLGDEGPSLWGPRFWGPGESHRMRRVIPRMLPRLYTGSARLRGQSSRVHGSEVMAGS